MIRILNRNYPCDTCVWFAGNGKCGEYHCWLCSHRRNNECLCNQEIPEGETECPYYRRRLKDDYL